MILRNVLGCADEDEFTPVDSEAGARRDMFYAESPRYQGDDNLEGDKNYERR